jgi:tRNA modification GTPase
MIPDPEDTIVALSSASGPGARAVIRITGSRAFEILVASGMAAGPIDCSKRHFVSVELRLSGVHSPLPADVYVWPNPHTYTGQDLLELHTISSPPLVELVIAQLLNAGARAAQPGEFTMRAFLAGKLDLTQAEAVLVVINARSPEQLKDALGELAGGVAQPLQTLRNDLLDLLADLEAGLDFAEEDIRFVDRTEFVCRLNKGLEVLDQLGEQLDQRALSERCFRAVLVGRPNAGKSSLFNRLARHGVALVSDKPGTTRDYLASKVVIDDIPVELVDTAGWNGVVGGIEDQALVLSTRQVAEADLLLLCMEAGSSPNEKELSLLAQTRTLPLATKCDLASDEQDWLATSAVTGAGIEQLAKAIAQEARKRIDRGPAAHLSRCKHHVSACRTHLSLAVAQAAVAPELVALELRGALDELGVMVGAVYTDDLLDRVFSRFCIGK